MSKKKRQISKGTSRRFVSPAPKKAPPAVGRSSLPEPAPINPKLLATVQKLWTEYQAKNPKTSITEFYRARGQELTQAAQAYTDLGERAILTAEGHPVLLSKATYFIQSDQEAILDTLNASEEFLFMGPCRSEPDCLAYCLVNKGRASIQPASEKPEGALILSGDISGVTILGDLNISTGRISLECLSPERLEAGKALLEGILGYQIRHWRDHFKTPDEFIDIPQDIIEPDEDEESLG